VGHGPQFGRCLVDCRKRIVRPSNVSKSKHLNVPPAQKTTVATVARTAVGRKNRTVSLFGANATSKGQRGPVGILGEKPSAVQRNPRCHSRWNGSIQHVVRYSKVGNWSSCVSSYLHQCDDVDWSAWIANIPRASATALFAQVCCTHGTHLLAVRKRSRW
jgi:hypothetical protein